MRIEVSVRKTLEFTVANHIADALQELMRRGARISAIKLLRAEANKDLPADSPERMGLREAKQVCEGIALRGVNFGHGNRDFYISN